MTEEQSTTTIPGVPSTITRDDYVRLVQSVGLSTRDLLSLEFAAGGIYATVRVRNAEGGLARGSGLELPRHRVFIEVVD